MNEKSKDTPGFRVVEPPDMKPKGSGATYATFIDFMGHVLMYHSTFPSHLNLKGACRGNPIYGYFCHEGRTWEVHSRTCYLPLEIALATAAMGKDPFVEVLTDDRWRLELNPALARVRQSQTMQVDIREALDA